MTTMSRFLKFLPFVLSATMVASRLVIYGPQELKDKFEYNGNYYKCLSRYILDFKIEASYANFGNIPYG